MNKSTFQQRSFFKSNIPQPKNLGFTFDTNKSYSLEIGAGAGLNAIKTSLEFPQRTHIAIERTSEKFSKMQSRYDNHQLKNLHIFQDDAMNWLAHNGKDSCLDHIYLPYPNPSPKNKSQRWCNMPFNHCLIASLKQNSILELWTNEEWYFNEAKEIYTQNWKLFLFEEKIISIDKNPDYIPRTHFEKKYFLREQKLYKLKLQKLSTSFWSFEF